MQLDLDAQLLGQGFGQLDFKAAELAAFINEAERWVGAFQADLDLAGLLDLAQLLAGHRLAQQPGAKGQAQCANQQCATQYRNSHDKPLCFCGVRSR